MPFTLRRMLAAGTALALGLQPPATDAAYYYRNVALGGAAAPNSTASPPVKGTGSLAVFAAQGARARPGVGFALPVTAQNPSGSVSWASTGAALPPGIALDAASGLLTGVPTKPGDYAGIVVTGTDADGNQGATQPIAISVVPRPSVAVQSSYAVAAGQPVLVAPAVSNAIGSQAWSLSVPLPLGLVLDGATGVITGTSDQAGALSGLVLTVRDSDGASGSSAPFSLSVTSAMSVYGVGGSYAARLGKPFAGLRPAVSGNANPVTWSLGTGTLPAGLSIDPGTGAVSGTPTQAAPAAGLSLRATDTVTGASVSSPTFSIAVGATPAVSLPATAYTGRVGSNLRIAPQASGLAGNGYWLLDGGSLPPGLSLDQTSGTISGASAGVGLTAGLSLRVIDLYDGASASSPAFSIRQIPALGVAGPGDIVAEAGQPMAAAIPSAIGLVGKPTWSLSGSLPTGIAADPTSGALSGTPSDPTQAPVTLRYALSDAGDGTSAQGAPFTLTVVSKGTFAVAGIVPSYTARTGNPFSLVPSVVGAQGQVAWQASALPAWASFNPASGAITGTPGGASSDAGLVLTVGDGAGQSASSQPFSIVAVPALAVSYAPGPITQGQPYALSPAVSNASGTVSFALSGALPSGLAFAPATGTISGTTSAAGVYSLSVTAADAVGTATSNAFSLSVPASSWSASIPPAPGAAPYGAFSVQATATGFAGPVTWSLASGTLPAWAALSASAGTVSGTPTAAGYFGPFALLASDGAGHAARTNDFSIAVTAQPALAATAADGTGTVNAPFRLAPAASNSKGALSWMLAAGNLPAWASLDPASGAIGGVPTGPATVSGLVLQVSDATGATAQTRPFSITVSRSNLQVASPPPVSAAVLGQPFSLAAPRVGGSSGALTWSIAPGTLPSWASLNPDGSIGGTPLGAAAVGTAAGLVLQVADGSGSSQLTQPFSIKVTRAPLSASAPAGATVHPGTALATAAPTVRNALGAVSWTIQPALPTGLSLDPATGIVSGTPAAAGTATYALTATDAFDGATAVAGGLQIAAVGNPVVTVPGMYTAQLNVPAALRPGVANVVGATAWKVAAGALPAGLTLDPDSGAIIGAATGLGTTDGIRIAVTDAHGATGTSAAFSIQVVKSIVFAFTPLGQYPPAQRVTVPYSSPTPVITNNVGTVSYAVASGTVPPGLSLDPATGVLSGTPSQAYTGSLTLVATDGNGSTATSPPLPFSIVAAPTVSVASLATRIGVPVNLVPAIANAYPNDNGYIGVTVTGGLPGWASVNPDGRYAIQGTPTQTGTYPGLVMKVTDVNGAFGSSQPFSISVGPGLSVSGIAASYAGRVGYQLSPTVQPVLGNLLGTASWTASGLPAGVSVDPKTGVVSGAPGNPMSGNATLVATDSADGATVSATVPLSIAPAIAVSGTADLVTHVGIDASTPAPGFTGLRGTAMGWSLATGTLPAWARLDPATGMVSVTNPPVASVTGLSLTATDNGDRATGTSAQFSLTVLPPLAVANVPTSYAAQVSVPFSSGAPSASNPIGAVTWKATGTLPSWAKVDPATGIISGTPDAVGTYANVTLTATDAKSTASSVAFTLDVSPLVSVSLASSSASGLLRVGDAYTLTPTPSGLQGSAVWSLNVTSGALPSGLTQKANGVVSGTVGAPGSATFTIGLQDASNGASNTSTPVSLTASPALGVSGVPNYSVRNLQALNTAAPKIVGAVGTITYALDKAVPAGMNPFNTSTGTMSGVPTGASGPTTYTLTATDSWDRRTASQAFTVQVFGALAFSTQPSGIAGTVGTTYAGPPPSVANAMGTLKYALMSGGSDISTTIGTTCPGLSFSTATGGFSGTPTAPCSVASLTEVVTDASDNSTATSTAFSVNVSYSAGATAYTLPILDSATNWNPNTPVTVARLYDGKNIYTGQGNYPQMWCLNTSTCEIVMHWSEPKQWNVMRIVATSNDVPNGIIVSYDSGDGVWRQLWTGRYNVIAPNGETASDPDGTITFNFATTTITRVKLTLQGYPGGWGHVDDWRFGYGSAPPIP